MLPDVSSRTIIASSDDDLRALLATLDDDDAEGCGLSSASAQLLGKWAVKPGLGEPEALAAALALVEVGELLDGALDDWRETLED